jgi:hypothetical protein
MNLTDPKYISQFRWTYSILDTLVNLRELSEFYLVKTILVMF